MPDYCANEDCAEDAQDNSKFCQDRDPVTWGEYLTMSNLDLTSTKYNIKLNVPLNRMNYTHLCNVDKCLRQVV